MRPDVIGRLKDAALFVYSDFRSFLAPASCYLCGVAFEKPDHPLCPACEDKLRTENSGFGPACPFCGNETDRLGSCVKCVPPANLSLYYGGEYAGDLKECIRIFKFGGVASLGTFLAGMCFSSAGMVLPWNDFDLMIPVPLHRRRLKERYYNQSEIVACEISRLSGIPIETSILIRNKSTRQQAKLDVKDRWNNVRNAFDISDGSGMRLKGKRIILVDDIVTTGATVFEASRPLIAAGVEKVEIFSLAYAR